MDKMRAYTKHFVDEAQMTFQLDYFQLIRSAEQGQVYGIAVQKSDASGVIEEEIVEGLFENRGEAEAFLSKLADGLALPVELIALCDDYISDRELKEKNKMDQAAS